ncbi:hypothetical protein BOX15_Mlig032480g1 [Macrostomum lignano]|uniref:Mab-21-like HhH/H2TH-like domain-containing protein n=1 Tax=Macrostomum lignano TaxID=282301 RepID=A0A267EW95_9PLAT|nr:hypothetical protein BOX15_Mlig032480g1 [Macrostomum lignano]
MPNPTKCLLTTVSTIARCTRGISTGSCQAHRASRLLQQMIQCKDMTRVMRWLEDGRDIECPTHSIGYTLLHAAARYNRVGLVECLIEGKANVNAQSLWGAAPLHFAVQKNSLLSLKRLLAVPGIQVGIRTRNGLSPLHYAADNGHLEAAELLVEAGADMNEQTEDGRAPLHFACLKGHKEFALWLIDSGTANCSLIKKDGKTALHLANFEDIARRLIEKGVGLNTKAVNGRTALFLAAASNNAEVVASLLKAGALVNFADNKGQTPFHIACNNNCEEVVRMLQQERLNPNASDKLGCSALHLAADNGHSEIVYQLLEKKKIRVNSRDCQGRTPLYFAAHRGQIKAVKLLAECNRTELNIQGNDGNTPLHAAADCGHTEVVEALLKAGCNVNLHNSTRSGVPLHFAADRGFVKIVQLLLGYDAEVDAKSSEGWTALHFASRLGRTEVARILVERGACVNSSGRHGWTPLHVATRMGHGEIVKLLIGKSADVGIELEDGNAPLHFAAQNGHPEIITMLLDAGASPTQKAHRTSATPIDLAAVFNRHVSLKLMLQSLCRKGVDLLNEKSLESLDRTKLKEAQELLSTDRPQRDTKIRSQELHEAMNEAGFIRERCVTQTAMSHVLEEIIQSHSGQTMCLTGSFSEGWGCSLTRLDGIVDLNSDLDMTVFIKGLRYHLKGFCKCTKLKESPEDDNRRREITERQRNTLEYSQGHVKFSGHSSNPVRNFYGSIKRPAMDEAVAYNCCSYPDMPILDAKTTKISKVCMDKLKRESLRHNSCHLVSAAPPGMEGLYIRVSTALLEKKMTRHLNVVQGQVLTILKYLTKSVVNKNKRALKSYHVKTLIYWMVNEVAEEEWMPNNLISLVEKALNKLAEDLERLRGC